MPITNTLENAKKLESLGAPTPLARGIAEIVEEAVQASNQDLKTFFREELARQIGGLRSELKQEIASVHAGLKQEIASVQVELKQEIASVHAGLKQEIASVQAELKQEIASVHAGLKQEIISVRAELQREMRQQLIWFFTMAAGIATIAVAIIKLFPNAG